MNSNAASQSLDKKQYWFIPLIFLFILFMECLYFAWDTGQTVDETYYNGSGYPIVRYNDYRILGEHPPLMMQLASLPLLILQPKYPIDDLLYNENSKEINISGMGSRFLYDMGNDPELILFIERIPMILVTVLLGYILYLWGVELYGIGGAALALTLYSFCPNIISNGSQLMTDMGVATFFFATFYRLKKFFDLPSTRNAALVGLCAGLALVSKISGFLLFPCIFILFLLFSIWNEKSIHIPQRESCWFDRCVLTLAFSLFFLALGQKLVFVAIAPLCLTVISVTLLQKVDSQQKFLPFLVKMMWLIGAVTSLIFMVMIARKRSMLITIAAIVWILVVVLFNLLLARKRNSSSSAYLVKTFAFIWLLAMVVIILDYTDYHITLLHLNVFRHYILSFNIASNHSILGHISCVPGSWVTCDWKYFISIMAIKTPVATLLLFVLGILAVMRSEFSRINKAILFIPIIVFFLFASFVNQIYIGIRHILPVYPFIFLVAGGSFSLIHKIKFPLIRKVVVSVSCILIVASIFRNVRFAPHQLTYFNEWIGSEVEGAKHSMLNVGQDNRRLAELIHRLKIPHVKIASIDNNPAEYNYYGLSWSYMDTSEYERPSPGYYVLDLDTYYQQQLKEHSWFRSREPDYKAGKILYVFKVRE